MKTLLKSTVRGFTSEWYRLSEQKCWLVLSQSNENDYLDMLRDLFFKNLGMSIGLLAWAQDDALTQEASMSITKRARLLFDMFSDGSYRRNLISVHAIGTVGFSKFFGTIKALEEQSGSFRVCRS